MSTSTRACPGCGRRLARQQRACSAECRREHMKRMDRERLDVSHDVEPIALSEPMTARYSGRCALCPKYIRARRSRIVSVPARPPRAGVRLDPDRLTWTDTVTGKPVPMHARAWAHEKCLDRALRQWQKQHPDPATQETE